MAKSDALEQSALEYWLTTTATGSIAIPARPTAWYVALFTADPTDADVTANEVDTTVDDTAYARQTVAFTVTGASADNDAAATFPAVVYGSGAAAYTITHFGIYDASTGGNLLYHGVLDVQNTLATSDQANIAAGDIVITEA